MKMKFISHSSNDEKFPIYWKIMQQSKKKKKKNKNAHMAAGSDEYWRYQSRIAGDYGSSFGRSLSLEKYGLNR